MATFVQMVGFASAALLAAALMWSMFRPHRRLWPPRSFGALSVALVWLLTCLVFGAVLVAGLGQWGELPFPLWLRAVGLVLFITGKAAVFREAFAFGFANTSGAANGLRRAGLYAYSRHPQYLADIVLLVGWSLLSASSEAALLSAAAILVLLLAPFAEEPWLLEKYGETYRAYARRVPRFI